MVPGASISAAPTRSPATSPGSGLSASPALALSFIAVGLGFLLATVVTLALYPALLALPYPHPHVVALVHVWLPGFLLTVCLGAWYQLTPVILGTKLRGIRAAWVHLPLHTIGVVALTIGLASGRYGLAAIGGSLVTLGTSISAGIVLWTFIDSSRRDAIAWSLPLAGGWLAITTLAGVVLATNRQDPWLATPVLALLGAHAHLGLIGFFLTLLQGVTFQLVPMFTLGQLCRPRCVAAGVIATQIGLPVIVGALAVGHQATLIAGAVILAGGLAATATALATTFASRRKRRLEIPLIAFCVGWGFLVIAGLQVALTRLRSGTWESIGATSAYGHLLIPGAFTLMVMGMLLKIVPFLTWMSAYGSAVGIKAVPRATELSRPRLEKFWLSLHLAALLLGWVALGLPNALGALMAQATPWLLLAGLTLYAGNLGGILAHLHPKLASRHS